MQDHASEDLPPAPLDASEARILQLVRGMCDNVPDLIWAKDLENRYVFANRAMSERLLCTEEGEDVVGKTDLWFAQRQRSAHPDNPEWHTFGEICRDSDHVVVQSMRPERFDEFGNVRGKFLFLDVQKAPFLDSEGKLIGTVGCGRDVTQQKQMEEELRRSELRFRSIFATAAVSIWDEDFSAVKGAIETLRAEGVTDFSAYLDDHPEFLKHAATLVKVIDVNDATLELFEAESKAELLGEVDRVLGPDSYEAFKQVVLAIAEHRPLLEVETTNVTLKGKTLEVLIRIAIPPGEMGLNHMLVSIIDLTARKQLELERRKAQKLESLGLLAGGIAHDFNNLLMGILGNISLAKQETDPGSKIHRRLEEAEAASDRARKLTQQLLTFAKGNRPVKRAVPVKQHLLNSAKFALSGSNVACTFNLPEHLWPIEADEDQIAQVVSNLVLNAAEAMPTGGNILLEARNRMIGPGDTAPLSPGNYVEIAVRDHGIGIPAERLPRIFDPYYTTKKQGSGLGLAITYSIIQKHGGLVTVNSSPGEGSTFVIQLPASAVEASPIIPSPGPLPRGQGRVLVMDDEDVVRKVATDMLEFLGYTVTPCASGGEMLELYQQAMAGGQPFDLVLMDLTIPGGMGGVEAARRLRQLDPNACAIVSSGYSNDPVFADPAAFGFQGLVAKPYRVDDLGRAVSMVLHGSRQDLVSGP